MDDYSNLLKTKVLRGLDKKEEALDFIKNKKSQTFNEYIYSFRLEHAYRLLIENISMSVAEVQLEAGFNSQPMFNTVFKAAYDMTPS